MKRENLYEKEKRVRISFFLIKLERTISRKTVIKIKKKGEIKKKNRKINLSKKEMTIKRTRFVPCAIIKQKIAKKKKKKKKTKVESPISSLLCVLFSEVMRNSIGVKIKRLKKKKKKNHEKRGPT